MTTAGRSMIIAGMASLLFAGRGMTQLTDAEFRCQVATSKAGAKFLLDKAKCTSNCFTKFGKGLVPESDCLPPYGGATSACINDTVLDRKGAENKFRDAIRKACDPAIRPVNDCPECYSGGDCGASGEAGNRVQNVEGQIDSFVPGVACERTGATPEEAKCQFKTAKALSKQAGGVLKCYDKCHQAARRGQIPLSSCSPPASDPATTECVVTVDAKAIAGVDKYCGDVGALPDCAGGTDNYPSGASWANLVSIAVSGNVPGNYCDD